MPVLSTVQAGSSVIGSASGDSLIVAPGDEDRFGIGASVIVWPSGQPLEPATAYDTMDVIDKTANTLTVLRNADHALDTIAEGDQVGLSFRSSQPASQQQTQVITFGKTDGVGPVIDLGANSLGLISLIEATISDVDLDGGSTGSFEIDITLLGSFDGTNFDPTVNGPSGYYNNLNAGIFGFTSATDPSPVYANRTCSRYLRFQHSWASPSDLGANASATITFKLTYY